MTYFRNQPTLTKSTSHIYRPFGGINDVREVIDRASPISVIAFPVRLMQSLVASELNFAACYILAGDSSLYIGETNAAGRRIGEHAADPLKRFTREVYIIRGNLGFRFTKETTAAYLQYGLTRAADEIGQMQLVAGCAPRLPELDQLEMPVHERLLDDAKRLLFDAGLTAFASPRETDEVIDAGETTDADDAGPMEIDVHLPRGSEFELRYDETIWARGYTAGDRFVVAAGSDIRIATNPSTSPVNRARRTALFEAGVLGTIPGAHDRMRLLVDVAFPSMAIAAKIASGAHVDSSKWRLVDPAQRPLMQL